MNFEEQLRPDEIIEKDGTKLVLIKGLRRIADENKLISNTNVDITVIPLSMNDRDFPYVAATYTISSQVEDKTVNFVGTADAWIGNTDEQVSAYPAAVAETRAESRALKRLLNINILCESEIAKEAPKIIVKDNKIGGTAHMVLINKLIQEIELDEKEITKILDNYDAPTLELLTENQAKTVIRNLNKMRTKNLKKGK